MKWPQDQIEIMRSGFEQFLSACSAETRAALAACESEKSRVYIVARMVDFDLQYDDNHPAYTAGKWDNGTDRSARIRMVKHNPAFVLYPAGCNDDHRWTMLKAVAKSVGLI